MSLCLALFLVHVVFIDVIFGQICLFTDVTNDEYKLDLESIQGLSLNYSDLIQPKFTYSYTICANNLQCDGNSVMMAQYDSLINYCYYLAIFDTNLPKQPSYDIGTEIWTFQDFIGTAADFCNDDTNRTTNILYHCNDTVGTAEISEVIEIGGEFACKYNVTVESRFACINATNSYCIWYNGNNKLDLISLSTTTITGIDDKNSSLVFAYTPCQNGVVCNSLDTMANLVNVGSLDCVSYLAVWNNETNGGVEPSYDSDNKVWQFIYTNGEVCNNQLSSEFFVYWYCDPTVLTYKVMTAALIAPCLYELEIASIAAC